MDVVIIGFFRYTNDAEAAVDRLLARAYPAANMALLYEEADPPGQNSAGATNVGDDQPIALEILREAMFGAHLTESHADYYRYCMAEGDAILAVRADDEAAAGIQAQFGTAFDVEVHQLGNDAAPAPIPFLKPQTRRAEALKADDARDSAQLDEEFARYGDAPPGEGRQPHYRAARMPLIDPRSPTVRMPTVTGNPTAPMPVVPSPVAPAPRATEGKRPFNVDKFTKPMPPKEKSEET